ncbi:hypothetical protein KO498_08680 [Lentibacter algarum]|uniref:hypothetical protein n=1 Tax=Lentibacter algarum TaxID=576131 RepID=UPI001C07785D|nr:hypothetical protein [Lentibacter algarum]MBU2981889.1 hypothetical protein [Lentibacter algarum]
MSEPAPLERAKNPPPVTTLLDDEAFLGTWQPDIKTFAIRALALGAVTALFIGPYFALNPLLWLPIMLITSLIYVFLFDDHLNWLRHRNDVWHLTSFRLIYENQIEPAQNATTNLHDIDTVKRVMWKSLRIRLFTGQSTVAKYLANPKSLKTAILQAKAKIEGTSDA